MSLRESDPQEYARCASFPDQSHWTDVTINGKPITEEQKLTIWYRDTDQGKAIQVSTNHKSWSPC